MYHYATPLHIQAYTIVSLIDALPFAHTLATDERFTNSLELAVRFGKTLVVQEVDRIHPILYPILRKDLLKQVLSLSVNSNSTIFFACFY